MAQRIFIFLFTLDVATYKVNNFFVPHKSSNQNKKWQFSQFYEK